MIAHNTGLGFFDYQIEAFLRIRPVADYIAEAINLFYAPFFDVLKNSRQGFNIRMYIADYGKHPAFPE